jgi:RNA polymerase primary sigma factor
MVAHQTLLDTPSVVRRTDGTDGMWPSPRPAAPDEATEGQVDHQWRRGDSIAVQSRPHGRSPSAIDEVINEIRARSILGQTLEYTYDASFDEPDADGTILVPMPDGGNCQVAAMAKVPSERRPYLADLYDAPLLSREQETHLFRKMNYLNYRASKFRESLDPARAKAADLDELERLQVEALDVKNQIIRANLRLVVSIAKKRAGASNNFFELISDGNLSLIRAVEKFDFARGFKFSTYASWAIIKNFARTIPKEKRRRDRFVTGHDEMFEAAPDHRSDEHESDHLRNQETVQRMLGWLSDRERRILVSRYGLDGAIGLTLEQIGKELGITKERVRQIESRAREKLRGFAERDRSPRGSPSGSYRS